MVWLPKEGQKRSRRASGIHVQAAHGLRHVIQSPASGGVTRSDFVKKPFWLCRDFESTRTRRPGNDQRTGRYGFCQLEQLRHSRLSYKADGRYDPEAHDTRRHT